MSMTMDENIKRWTAKRKTALVIEIIQGKTVMTQRLGHYMISFWNSAYCVPRTRTNLSAIGWSAKNRA
jgi:hypothetical protein